MSRDYAEISLKEGFYELNVFVSGECVNTLKVDVDNFVDMDFQDLDGFVDDCLYVVQNDIRDNHNLEISDKFAFAIKQQMFDNWKYHFGIESISKDDVNVVRVFETSNDISSKADVSKDYAEISLKEGFYELNVFVSGECVNTLKVDVDNFVDVDFQDLDGFVDDCLYVVQNDIRDNHNLEISDKFVFAIKQQMFDNWKHHFGIEDMIEDGVHLCEVKSIGEILADATRRSEEGFVSSNDEVEKDISLD